VREPGDPAPSDRPAAPSTPPRPRRAKKFVLPEHHHRERADARATEHIEAFLEGPGAQPRHIRVVEHERRPLELQTRQDWTAALNYEGARHARYGRPASVLLIGLSGSPHDQAVDRIARTIADVIRAEARETDRAVRTSTLGFRLLLPETGARAARTVADRLAGAFRSRPDGRSDGVELCIDVASAARNGTLQEAVGEAEARHEERTGR
jgi:GGDEF domain-containing protein